MRVLLVLAFFVILVLAASLCWAYVTQRINYQGMLTDDTGNPLNGEFDLTFRIYDQLTLGTMKWTETQYNVLVTDGLFNVNLGDSTAIDLPFNEDYWVEIEIEGSGVLSPRLKLTSVPYAYRAQWSDTSTYSFQALKADTAAYAQSGMISDSDWVISGNNMYSAVPGSVGIGTTSPNAALEIVGTGIATHLKLTNPDTPGPAIYLNAANKDWVIWGTNPGADAGDKSLVFRDYTAAENRMVIDSLGNVGIGTVSPSQMLDVADTVQMSGFKMPSGASDGYVLTSDVSGKGTWQPASGGASRWTLTDSVLYTNNFWGIARGGARNALLGDSVHTLVNLGVTCTTGAAASLISYATVSGGQKNAATNSWCTVGGGESNRATGGHATISGGRLNNALLSYTTIAGGRGNTVNGYAATTGGGMYNTVISPKGGVFSGESNQAGDGSLDTAAFIGGGYDNEVKGMYATVCGGRENSASVDFCFIGGGRNNIASWTGATIAGGYNNQATDFYTTIGGGQTNTASEDYTTIGGGFHNEAAGIWSTLAGGYQNTSGNGNIDTATFVGGGYYNAVLSKYGTVCGGHNNIVDGAYSAILGGYKDSVAGDYSFAFGDSVILTNTADNTFAFGRKFTTSSSSAVIFNDSDSPIKVGIQTTDPKRALHVSDVLRLEPRDSAPSTPSEGDIYVNSTDHHIYCYLGSAWKQLDN